ncbi:MAG: LacI family DNA-binding transcriptional regulator [Gammaproteobacteria bacterium]
MEMVSKSVVEGRVATIRDVAARAGVSIKTVSRVSNGAHNVHPDTRLRVQVAIDALNYRPNPVAASLGRMRRREPVVMAGG